MGRWGFYDGSGCEAALGAELRALVDAACEAAGVESPGMMGAFWIYPEDGLDLSRLRVLLDSKSTGYGWSFATFSLQSRF